MKTLTLKSGHQIPALGLGTWLLEGNQAVESVQYALELGYRHIDTAEAYGNQNEVGSGIKESGVDRDDIFITSKVFRNHLTPQGIVDSCHRTLKELRIDHLDLLLLHWPNRTIPILDQLTALNSLKEMGLTRSIGVSNFTIRHLKDAIETGIKFEVNQVEYHPSLNQIALKQFCDDNGIIVTAYSPIGRGQDLKLPAVIELADKYKKTPSQITLNWIIAKGMVAIPKSGKTEHIADNFGALDFEMEPDDIEKLSQLNTDNRVVNPAHGDFDYL